MWQLLIIFYFIFGTTSYLLRRVLAQKIGEHNRLINAVFFLFFLLPAAIILSFFFPHNLHVGTLNLMLLLGGSLIWPLYYLISFHANKKVDVGIFTIINNLSPLFTLAIALPFLHETLRTGQFIGAGLLIASGVIAASSKIERHNLTSMSGIFICLLAALFLGVGVAYEGFMLNRVDFGAYLVYGWGAQVAWSLIFAPKELKKLPQLLGKAMGVRTILLAWGAASVLRSVSFISSLKTSGSASVVSAASDFLSVAVVIAAYFFLRERQHIISKVIAVVIGVAGLLLIAG